MVKWIISGDKFIPIDTQTMKPCRIDTEEMVRLQRSLSPNALRSLATPKSNESYTINIYVPSKTQECRVPVGILLQINASLVETFTKVYVDLSKEYTKDAKYLMQDDMSKITINCEFYSMEQCYIIAQYIADAIAAIIHAPVSYSITSSGFGASDTLTEPTKLTE